MAQNKKEDPWQSILDPKNMRCICGDPLWIVIEPGKFIIISCPVHGEVKIYGTNIIW